jgi:hypothetical protein
MSCFSEHADLFGSMSNSAATLFALLNGDSMLQIFQTLRHNTDTTYQFFAHIC